LDAFLKTFELLGALGIFFFGLKVMSEAFLALRGDHIRQAIRFLAKNRIGGIFTGFFITGLIHSSAATTVLVVSLVNARIMKLREAVSIIMGANLGTTLNFWIVALLGFGFKLTAMVMPAIALGVPFLFSKIEQRKKWGESLIGFGLAFMGLDLLKDGVPSLMANPDAVAFLARYTGYGFGSTLLFLVFGILMSVVVQSSSAAGAITLVMAYRGWIDFPIAAATVLGQNIGTTVTAQLAAIGTSQNARRAAGAHFLFNFIGVLWVLLLLPYFLEMVDYLVPGELSDPANLPTHLAAFHTLFNLITILLLVGFVPQLTELAKRLVKGEKTKTETEPDVLEQAQAGITQMSEMIGLMFARFAESWRTKKGDLGPDLITLSSQERLTDHIQEQISNRLIQHSQGLVARQVALAMVDLMVLDRLEGIADRIMELMNRLEKKRRDHLIFSNDFRGEVDQLVGLVGQMLNQTITNLESGQGRANSDTFAQLAQLRHQFKTNPPQLADLASHQLGFGLIRSLLKIGEACRQIDQQLSKKP